MTIANEIMSVLNLKKVSDATKILGITDIVKTYLTSDKYPKVVADQSDKPTKPSRNQMHMDDPERKLIVMRHEQGMSVPEIAEKHERSMNSIIAVIKGYPKNSGRKITPHKKRMVTQTHIDTVAKEYFNMGRTPKQIAKLIGRTTNATSAIVSKIRDGHYKPTVNFDKKFRRRKGRTNGSVQVSPETRIPAKFRHFEGI